MANGDYMNPIEILLVEDNPADVRLTQEALKEEKLHNNLHANCYIQKPIDLTQFSKVVKSIQDFWLTIVKLPPKTK